jgi:hypothetical protein
VEDDPAEKDDNFEVDLEAVDVVSFALAVVSLGFNALVSDSMSVATSLGMSFTDGQQIIYNLKTLCTFGGGKC